MTRFELFSLSVFGITHYWNRIATDTMKEYGLKGAYGFYLIILANSGEPLTSMRLSEITLRDKADVSRAVTQFRKQGLVKNSESQKYRAPIVLTKKGYDLASQIQTEADNALKAAGVGLSEEMRICMYESLDIIYSNLKRLHEGD
ncbi:MAG: MarR family transcriptional regulator [Lachnospiraceae bacterium]|nr:MarR family transcriptional regulator [Lachnospiraceae bacterium]